MNTDIVIRRLGPEDAKALSLLEEACFSVPWTEQGFLDALVAETSLFLGAFGPGDKLVGYCGVYMAADEGEITNVAVDADCRNRGIAKTLINRLCEAAAARGVRQIFLEVRESNAAAQNAYGQCGFTDCGRRKGFYRLPDEDALVMKWEMD